MDWMNGWMAGIGEKDERQKRDGEESGDRSKGVWKLGPL